MKIENISIENFDKFSVLLLSLKNCNMIRITHRAWTAGPAGAAASVAGPLCAPPPRAARPPWRCAAAAAAPPQQQPPAPPRQ